jgi:hypothetical protein
MLDRAALWLDPAQGDRLDLNEYRRDFGERRARISGGTSWKFERRQHFKEPGDPSWEAFQHGRWQEAMRILEAEREGIEHEAREDVARAHRFRRVRIVEEPLAPYLQWELNALRIQAECGKPIRVVPGEAVHHLEVEGSPLPEVVVLDEETLYEVRYTKSGVLDGGIRFTDGGLVKRWARFTAELFAKGEDMIAYAERALDHLPPPQPEFR